MSRKEIVNTLVVTESWNDADNVKRRLQEAGHMARVEHVGTLEDLDDALDTPDWDLVLLDMAVDEVTVGDALELMRDKKVYASLIAVTRDPAPDKCVVALRLGARDVVPWEPEDYLSLIVDRELSTLYDRRAYVDCRGSLAESEQRARMLLDTSKEALGYLQDGMHVYANPAYLQMFGFNKVDDIRSTPILDLIKAKQHKPFKKFLRNHSKEGAEQGSMDLVALDATGKEFNVSLALVPAKLDGEPCIQAVFRDKRKQQQQQSEGTKETTLEDLTRIDPATRVFTAQYFMDQLGEAAGAGKSGVSVLLFALDSFPTIKDKVGLAGADEVLKDTAGMLRESVGDSGWLARLGTETFAYVVEDHTTTQMEALAETLRKQIEDMIYEASGQSVTTTASVAVYPPDYTIDDAQAVLSRLEHCISTLQRSGGNAVEVYHPGGAVGEDENRARLLQLQEALAARRMTPMYRAIINLQGETNETYQVLPYLTTDTGDRLPIEQFHQVAADANLVTQIDKLLFAHLIKTLVGLKKEGKTAHLFFPLSEESLTNAETPRWLGAHLKAGKLDNVRLTVDIPEDLAVKYLKQMQGFINAIKAIGIGSALEIGNMPSAFHHLKQMDVDFFHLPANLVRELATKEDSQELVQGLTKELLCLGKPVIAAGVKDANTMALLWEYGADYVHGAYVHKPSEAMTFDFSGGG